MDDGIGFGRRCRVVFSPTMLPIVDRHGASITLVVIIITVVTVLPDEDRDRWLPGWPQRFFHLSIIFPLQVKHDSLNVRHTRTRYSSVVECVYFVKQNGG